MADKIKPEEKILIKILADLFNGRKLSDTVDADWVNVFNEAEKHGVLPLLYDILADQNLPDLQRYKLYFSSKKMAVMNYHLFFLTRYLLNVFSEAGIPVVVLKGVSVSYLYPVPEYRKSGDIDLLLLDESRLEEANKILTDIGLKAQECEEVHNSSWVTPDLIEIEFHTMLIEPGKHEEFNQCYKEQIKRLNGQFITKDVWDSPIAVLPDGYQAYSLLLHMLHHFIREGFGLKLLCDWIVFWNRPVAKEDIDQYLSLINEIHLENFAKMITSVCYRFLDMNGNKDGIYVQNDKFVYAGGEFCDILSEDQAKMFLMDLLEGGEFGQGNKNRLVTMESSSVLNMYISEFHYAMRRKFPRAGKCFLFWPGLWIATLFIFIKENHENKRNGIEVIKKSTERSQMIEELELFK